MGGAPEEPEPLSHADAYIAEFHRVCPRVTADGFSSPSEPLPGLSLGHLTDILRALPDDAGLDAFYAAWRGFAAANPEAVLPGDWTAGFDFVEAVGDEGSEVLGPPPAPVTIDDLYRSFILSGEPVRRARQMATDLERDIDSPGGIWVGDTLLYVALLSPDHEERIREYLQVDPGRMAQELDRLRTEIAAREANPGAPVVENYYDHATGTWVTPETRYRDVVSDPRFAHLEELISSKPERAWPLLLELIATVPEDILYLAAEGPLEIFLAKHGKAFVESIEAQARSSDRFRSCLTECHIPYEIQDRVFAAMRPAR